MGLSKPERPLPTQGQAPVRQGTMPLLRNSFSVFAMVSTNIAPLWGFIGGRCALFQPDLHFLDANGTKSGTVRDGT